MLVNQTSVIKEHDSVRVVPSCKWQDEAPLALGAVNEYTLVGWCLRIQSFKELNSSNQYTKYVAASNLQEKLIK